MKYLKEEHDELYHSELSPLCFDYIGNLHPTLELRSDNTLEVYFSHSIKGCQRFLETKNRSLPGLPDSMPNQSIGHALLMGIYGNNSIGLSSYLINLKLIGQNKKFMK